VSDSGKFPAESERFMVIFLDKQRPPKKKMGRKQRRGTKSNPRTGVQWANWKDVPGSGGMSGSTGPTDPYITNIVPTTIAATAAATTITVKGARFAAGCTIEFDNVAVPTTFVSATTVTTSYDPTVAKVIDVTVRRGAEESNTLKWTVTPTARDAEADEQEETLAVPTSKSLKGEIIEWLVQVGGYEEEGLDTYSKAELLDLVEE
jgi:hypothetical protein